MTSVYSGLSGASRPMDRYVFTVAQIFNLPYRRFVIGKAPIIRKTLNLAAASQVKNLRYSRLESLRCVVESLRYVVAGASRIYRDTKSTAVVWSNGGASPLRIFSAASMPNTAN